MMVRRRRARRVSRGVDAIVRMGREAELATVPRTAVQRRLRQLVEQEGQTFATGCVASWTGPGGRSGGTSVVAVGGTAAVIEAPRALLHVGDGATVALRVPPPAGDGATAAPHVPRHGVGAAPSRSARAQAPSRGAGARGARPPTRSRARVRSKTPSPLRPRQRRARRQRGPAARAVCTCPPTSLRR